MIYVLWNGGDYSDRQTLFVEVPADDRADFYDMVKAAGHEILGSAGTIEWRDGSATMTMAEWAKNACPYYAEADDEAAIARLACFPAAIVRDRLGWDAEVLAAYEKARRKRKRARP